MTFSRSARTDRRRRVMREAVAADSSIAVENLRIRKRRTREALLEGDEDVAEQRDPGYSQAVRRACQQRLVQLIPVRASSLWLVISGMWLLWGGLLGAHYWFHIRPTTPQTAPVSFLLHLRSTHGIAHWLGSQLWMLTAIASLMIFQLRRHKLDDYRAKYRLWAVLAVAALVSSLDVSSSGLFLLGKSLDAWTIREVGYPGWTVVLATFATLVGVLGLRLCSELKSAPTSVAFWLIGLLSWGGSALLGTDLIKSPWSRPLTDMIVGGAWLGGILAVFLAAGIYLRHIYIQAQRRFLMRSRMVQRRQAWKLPKMSWRRGQRDNESDEGLDEERSVSKRRSNRKRVNENENEEVELVENTDEEVPRRSWLPKFAFSGKNRREEDLVESTEEGRTDKARSRNNRDEPEVSTSESKRQWLRLPRWRSDPRLGPDFSDVDAERRVRDEGFDQPMPKKSGWFAKGEKSVSQESSESNTRRVGSATIASDEGQQPAGNRRWFQRTRTAKPVAEKKPKPPKEPKPPKAKRNWNLWKKTGSVTLESGSNESSSSRTSAKNNTASSEAKPRRGWFGMFDGMKLSPPKATDGKSTPTPVNTSSSPIPSSSQSQRNNETRPTSNTPSSSMFQPAYDDEDADDGDNRQLSKAERKRLRRQQENRRAA